MGRSTEKIQSKDSQIDRENHFEEVYRLYFRKLYAYSKVITNSNSLAQDVVSDVFFNLWKSKSDLRVIRDIEVYLIVAVRNQSKRALKRFSTESSAEHIEIRLEAIDYVDPQEVLLERELLKVLDKVISDLPPQCSLIYQMSKEQGLRGEEIASELGISPVTVKSQLRKAQLKLREALNIYNQSDEASFPGWGSIGLYLLLTVI